MKKILRIGLFILLAIALAFGSLLLYSTLTDYQPEAIIPIAVEDKGKVLETDTLRVMIWNIGYAGLFAEMDFFNDGGKAVRADESSTKANLKAIAVFLETMADSVDFMLLQEVDRNSKRSYYQDQVEWLAGYVPEFNSQFALNYDVKFVPVPFRIPYTPYGKTYGGLQSLSRFKPGRASRVQYPGGFSWPTKLYMLDRCALEQSFPLKNGKTLWIVNTHNTAYDATGEIKKVEMEFMRERYGALAAQGDYVIIGGDFNQTPPGIEGTRFSQNIAPGYTPHALDPALIPNAWSIAADTTQATNRSNVAPYEAGKSFVILIDYFMHSPNVELLDVRTIDMQFRYSDHQPVVAKFVLKQE